MIQSEPTPEFSRCVPVADIESAERIVEISADAVERAALADRFDLCAVESLDARLRLRCGPLPGSVIVQGDVSADVVQTCVVTLEPVATHLDNSVALVFAPAVESDEAATVDIVVDANDPPEPLVGDAIDIGEVVAEHLALVLDPYPRAPGAALDQESSSNRSVDRGETTNPFARLRETDGSG